MAATKIGESHLTIEWLRQTLENVTKPKPNLLNWSATKIGVGQGYMSLMLNVWLEWENPQNLPSNVVLKIPNCTNFATLVDNEETAKNMHSSEVCKTAHNTECMAYEFLVQYQNMPTAKIYRTDLFKTDQDPGVIMMQYLNDGALVNMVDGFNLKQLFSVSDGLARIQAKSLENRDWINKFDTQKMRQSVEALLMGTMNDAELKIKPDFPEFYAKYVEPIVKNVDLQDLLDMQFDAEKKFGMTSVFVHGDFWANNMMFRKDENRFPSDELLAFFDFQLAHPGSCAHDLSQLLVTCCDPDVRRAHSKAVFEYYFAQLNHYTQERTVPFTFDQVWMAHKNIQQCFAVFLVLFTPVFVKIPEIETAGDCVKERNIMRIIDRAARAADDILGHLL